MAQFPHLEKEVTNSQIAEQYHSELERSDLTGSLSGMTQVNFMLSCRFFMFLHNMRARQDPKQILPLRVLIEQMQSAIHGIYLLLYVFHMRIDSYSNREQ